MSDDDLPPPPARPQVNLDDSDDDLPPPPGAAAAKPVVNLDDSDDDLPPPPAKPAAPPQVNLDDSDDDLPPPPGATAKAAPPPEDDGDDLPPPPSKPAAAAPAPAAAAPAPAPAASAPATEAAPRGRGATLRRNASSVYKEGFLFKQQPTWPHSRQKRWCVLKGRMLSYYENQTAAKPSGTLDLKGATIDTDPKEAKAPFSFGIGSIQGGSSGSAGGSVSKARVFIFSCQNRDELQSWLTTFQSVIDEPRESELHWFEKMAQGIF